MSERGEGYAMRRLAKIIITSSVIIIIGVLGALMRPGLC